MSNTDITDFCAGKEENFINIKEVAKIAGVSVATISRVMNHPEQVQPETKNHVLNVMRELDYQPNWFARGLNFGKTGTIALLIPSIEDHSFVDIVTGVETIAKRKDHTVLLCNTHADGQEELKYLKMVLARQVDGVILVSSQLDETERQGLLRQEFPWVHIGIAASVVCPNICFIDYKKGAYQITSHLLRMGHREIMLLLESTSYAEMDAIEAGYRCALEECGNAGAASILRVENSVQGGYLVIQKLRQRGCLPPALIASGTEQALGIAKAALEERIDIPRQMALACLEDSQISSVLNPPLTALELPTHQLGLVAGRMLFDCIESGDTAFAPQKIILQPTPKVRRSCGNSNPIYELFS